MSVSCRACGQPVPAGEGDQASARVVVEVRWQGTGWRRRESCFCNCAYPKPGPHDHLRKLGAALADCLEEEQAALLVLAVAYGILCEGGKATIGLPEDHPLCIAEEVLAEGVGASFLRGY
jgi:hypothetical protein